MRSSATIQGRRVLITGAGAGIGKRLALDFAGHRPRRLILLDRDAEALERLTQEPALRECGVTVEFFTCDIGSKSEIETFVGQLGSSPLDLLINNAGVNYSGPFSSMRLEDFENVLAINLLGAVRLTHALLPRLLEGSDPSIVNVASLAGLVAGPGMCAYSTSKFALVGFSEALRKELRGKVHVCTICPGLVRTDIARNTLFNAKGDDGGDGVERSSQTDRMDEILKKFGATPEKISKIVMESVAGKKSLVLINAESYFAYYLKMLFPALSDSVWNLGYQKLINMGVFKR